MHRARRLLVPAALVATIVVAAAAAVRDPAEDPPAASHAKALAQRALAGNEPAPTYFADVKPILDGRCATCHRVGGIAPFALTSYEPARLHAPEIAGAVAARIMPPWHAQRGIRRYLHDPSLTGHQIDTIVRWAKAGAPRGDAAKARPALASVSPPRARADRRIRLAKAYTPKGWLPGGDDYHCFDLPWKAAETEYVTGFNALPGVPAEVHHILVFVAAPSEAATVDAWDAADPGPGYRCYGGASAVGAPTIAVRLLAGWAPGLFGGKFPAGTGIEVPPGSRLILQFHYNLEHVHLIGGPKPDRSTLEFEVAKSVARRAAMVSIVNPSWIFAPATLAIPPGGREVRHSWSGNAALLTRFLGGLDDSKGLTIDGAILHMHKLGVSGAVTLEHASGRSETLLRIPRWDFNWQRAYFLADPPTVRRGDRLGVSCTHRNTTGRLVTWGESSSDEMCVGFVYVAERR
jgi:Copper type II ascorbate-dependent monooxygenase, C-terminal domain